MTILQITNDNTTFPIAQKIQPNICRVLSCSCSTIVRLWIARALQMLTVITPSVAISSGTTGPDTDDGTVSPCSRIKAEDTAAVLCVGTKEHMIPFPWSTVRLAQFQSPGLSHCEIVKCVRSLLFTFSACSLQTFQKSTPENTHNANQCVTSKAVMMVPYRIIKKKTKSLNTYSCMSWHVDFVWHNSFTSTQEANTRSIWNISPTLLCRYNDITKVLSHLWDGVRSTPAH